MPHSLVFHGRSAVLRWQESPTLAELEVVSDRVEAWAAEAPSALVVVLAPELTVPEAAVRARLQERIGALLPRLGWRAMVVEGAGLRADTKRLFVRAMAALAGAGFNHFASLEEALRALPPGFADPAALRAELGLR